MGDNLLGSDNGGVARHKKKHPPVLARSTGLCQSCRRPGLKPDNERKTHMYIYQEKEREREKEEKETSCRETTTGSTAGFLDDKKKKKLCFIITPGAR